MGADPNPQRIALVVPTRDRPDILAETLLPALADLAAAGVAVLVVDQSSGPQTADLIAGVEGVGYVRSGPGTSRGRNVGVAETSTPLIAFTDDDVTLGPGWLDAIVSEFDRVEDAGAVCGRGVTPSGALLPGSRRGVYRWPTNPFGLGSGFNMAFRREALEAVGPFDEDLGGGARYGAGEDTDMLYRILRAGWSVVCSDEITVVHHDWRSPADELRVHRRYGVGAGAQTAKHLAAGDRRAGRIALRHAGSHLLTLGRSAATLRVHRARLQIAYLAGFAGGFRRRRRDAV
jgi:GT2 family glycosyltransferase